MDIAAILVMWPRPFEEIFVAPSHGGSIWNLASNGLVVSEEKMFENVDIHTYIHTYRQQRPTYTISSPVSLRIRWAKKFLIAKYYFDKNYEITWLFPDFLGIQNFSDHFPKFPEFSLTFQSSLTFPRPWRKINFFWHFSLTSGHPVRLSAWDIGHYEQICQWIFPALCHACDNTMHQNNDTDWNLVKNVMQWHPYQYCAYWW